MIVRRPSLEQRVLQTLESSRIPVVLGGSGSGRTSLLLRLNAQLGPGRSQYIDLAAVATTPECCLSALARGCTLQGRHGTLPASADSPRAAFDAILAFFDDAIGIDNGPVTFLLDDVGDLRTFENFPGLRHVQKELITRLATSTNRFVLTSAFTNRGHRLLRDAPARFEVVHVPPMDAAETAEAASLFSQAQADRLRQAAPIVTALANGRPAYVHLLLGAMSLGGATADPIAALVSLFGADGALTSRCRASYEFRLQRARGYGALRAILGVLADAEPLNLTEIAQRMQRTPGSTKDYLSWLEDVDLVTVQRKRYAFEDPLLRLFVRLYGRVAPPTANDLTREIQAYADPRLGRHGDGPPLPASPSATMGPGPGVKIEEID